MSSSKTSPSAPVPDPSSKPGSLIDKLVDRLPEKINPAWFIAALLIPAAAVVGIAFVVGPWLAGAGGIVGLAALVEASRKRS
ncbi:MAG TPA: hypothetical protein VGL47_27310 [Amycolatopsis sp.]|uniref:hypothetical protein n=1 Tax=Amycolatopsis sp. TaxID=37632 RepID=UPI002F4120C1